MKRDCKNCIFNYEYDMAIGYGCKLDILNRDIKQSKKYEPITPDWCPVNNGEVKPFLPDGLNFCGHLYVPQDHQWSKCAFCGDIKPA